MTSDRMWKADRIELEGLYSAYLSENADSGMCLESIWLGDQLIHREEFPASRLGEADRQTYVSIMLASVIRRQCAGA